MAQFAVVFLIAVLSGLGVGSGGLLVIYLTLVNDVPQLTAQGINLVFFILASFASTVINFKKRKIPISLVVILGAIGVLGSLLGTSLAVTVPEEIIRKIFGAMLTISGIFVLKKK